MRSNLRIKVRSCVCWCVRRVINGISLGSEKLTRLLAICVILRR